MKYYVITPELCDQGFHISVDTVERANKVLNRVIDELSEVEKMQTDEPIILMTVPQCSACKRWNRIKYSNPQAPIEGDCNYLDTVTFGDFGCLEFDPLTP